MKACKTCPTTEGVGVAGFCAPCGALDFQRRTGYVPETREQKIARGEREGWLVSDCLGCKERYEAKDPTSVFVPNHQASTRCESGRRPHCTCDTCF